MGCRVRLNLNIWKPEGVQSRRETDAIGLRMSASAGSGLNGAKIRVIWDDLSEA